MSNNKGFTISEMLISLLVISLIVVILGGGIVVVQKTYKEINLKAEGEVLMSTAATKIIDEMRFAKKIEMSEVGFEAPLPTFESDSYGGRIFFTSENDGIKINTIDGQKIPLLTDKTMTSGLVPSVSYEFVEDKIKPKDSYFRVDIKIKSGNNDSYIKQRINVTPINYNL